MVIASKHLFLQIVAYLVYQIYLQKRFPTNKIPNNTVILKVIFMTKNVINGFLGYIP